jgi:hypothetical protein
LLGCRSGAAAATAGVAGAVSSAGGCDGFAGGTSAAAFGAFVAGGGSTHWRAAPDEDSGRTGVIGPWAKADPGSARMPVNTAPVSMRFIDKSPLRGRPGGGPPRSTGTSARNRRIDRPVP